MMAQDIELIMVLVAVAFGAVSAGYFYRSADIFVTMLKRPLHFISAGMMLMILGVLLAAYISFGSSLGGEAYLYKGILPIIFFMLYIVGSLIILYGARQLTRAPRS